MERGRGSLAVVVGKAIDRRGDSAATEFTHAAAWPLPVARLAEDSGLAPAQIDPVQVIGVAGFGGGIAWAQVVKVTQQNSLANPGFFQ